MLKSADAAPILAAGRGRTVERGTSGMAAILVIGGVFAFLAVVWSVGVKLEKKRRERLRAAPRRWGSASPTSTTRACSRGFTGFNLFQHGRSRRIRNIAYGRVDDVEVMLFDYSYVTGSGKNRRTHDQTVGFFQSDALLLPEFVARPEGLFDKIGQVFGYQDIDLPMHPEFSRRYILRGTDESRDPPLLHVRRRPLLRGQPGSERRVQARPVHPLPPRQAAEAGAVARVDGVGVADVRDVSRAVTRTASPAAIFCLTSVVECGVAVW